MGTNRKIKSDGEIHIDGTNVDIESTVDVTGDVNTTGDVGGATSTITGDATVGGTLGVTGQATLSGIAYPTADGTADQVLTTDGSGTLSFATAASGGGVDVDTVASASDATNYTGTARFINITSTADVTFTNTSITDRIIYINTNASVTFTCENFVNNIYKGNGSGSLTIKSPYENTPGQSGNDTIVSNCDIKLKGTLVFLSGTEDPAGIDGESLDLFIDESTINASTVSLDRNDDAFGNHKIENTSINCNLIIGENYAYGQKIDLIKGTYINTGTVTGTFDVQNKGTIKVTEGEGPGIVKIYNGSTVIIGSSGFDYPFEAGYEGVKALVIAQSGKVSDQSCNQSVLVTFGDTNTSYGYIDNTSSLDSNGKFTAPIKGFYNISSVITVTGSDGVVPTSVVIAAELYLNGSDVKQTSYPLEMQYTASTVIFKLNLIVDMAVNDYLEIETNSSDTNYQVKGGNYSIFSVNKVN